MPADTLNPGLEDPKQPKSKAREVLSETQRSFSDTARKAEKAMHEGLDTLRAQGRAYADTAGQYLDDTQRYVVERVKERPVTATLAGLGVGVLLGLLLASRSGRK